MQGPSHLDLAKTLADEHLRNSRNPRLDSPKAPHAGTKLRQWAGYRLINIGERLATRAPELQLKVSTAPPCP